MADAAAKATVKTNAKTNAIKAERDRFLSFAFAAADLLLEVSNKGAISFASGAARGLLRKSEDQIIGTRFLDIFSDRDKAYIREVIRRLGNGGRIDPVTVRMAGDPKSAVHGILGGFRMPGGDKFHFSLMIADRLQTKEPIVGERDEQTGLLDEKAFLEVARERAKIAANRLPGDSEEQLSMLVVEGIEKLRAEKGEAAVERFMAKLGARLRASSVGGDAAAMLGDGKLGLIHDDKVSAEELRKQANLVAREVAREEGVQLEVQSFAVDMAVGDMNEADATRALMYAIHQFGDVDPALYSIDSLTEAASEVLNDTLGRVADLRDRIESRAFEIAYQPIVDLDLQTVHHYEALTRFEAGASPASIIGFAEDVGMIEDFDLLMVQRVAESLIEKEAEGWKPEVAVNLSARSVASNVFMDSVQKVLDGFPSVNKQIIFEITETASVRDFESFNTTVQKMRNQGYIFCLDDVGSGSTSFMSIERIHVDYAKLDGEYIQNMGKSPRHKKMLETMVALCRDMKVKMVAEMIDDEEQRKMLLKMDVEYGQGYLFGRPSLEFEDPSKRRSSGPTIRKKAQKGQWR